MSEQITLVTVLFASMLAFALLVERALEVLKAAYDLIDSKLDFHRFWTARTYRTQQYIEERLRVFEYVDGKGAAAVFNRFNELLLGPNNGYHGTVPMLCGDLVRGVWVRLFCKIIGVSFGIVIALTLKFDLLAAARPGDVSTITPTTLGMLATGVAIGLGAGPVHKLIRVAEKKRQANLPQVVTNA